MKNNVKKEETMWLPQQYSARFAFHIKEVLLNSGIFVRVVPSSSASGRVELLVPKKYQTKILNFISVYDQALYEPKANN